MFSYFIFVQKPIRVDNYTVTIGRSKGEVIIFFITQSTFRKWVYLFLKL